MEYKHKRVGVLMGGMSAEREVSLATGEAICVALDKDLRGVFNVAGPPPLPLSVMIHQAGRANVPIPEPLFNLLLGRFGLPRLPRGALAHVKYPVVIDSSAFGDATGWQPAHDEDTTLHEYRVASDG